MAWTGPTTEKPVWCSVSDDKSGKPTAQSVNCVTRDPGAAGTEVASLEMPPAPGAKPSLEGAVLPVAVSYTKFTSQRELGNYLIEHYRIRKPNELSSCEVCHR
jgi:hypothetical protein